MQVRAMRKLVEGRDKILREMALHYQ